MWLARLHAFQNDIALFFAHHLRSWRMLGQEVQGELSRTPVSLSDVATFIFTTATYFELNVQNALIHVQFINFPKFHQDMERNSGDVIFLWKLFDDMFRRADVWTIDYYMNITFLCLKRV